MTQLPVRWSHLREFAKSPAHYVLARDRGIADTRAMRIGRVVDALLFNAKGAKKPVVFEGTRRGAKWEEFQAQNAGREIVTDTEYDASLRIVDSLLDPRHAHAFELLKGRRFQELNFTYLNRACQSHPDVIGQNGLFATDLKVSVYADPRRFVRYALNMGYHGQLAFYDHGIREAGAGDPQNLYIVAADPTPPNNVTAFRLTERAIDAGRRLVRSHFEQLLACEAADHWPGYTQDVVELDAADEFELMFDEEE